MLIFYHNTNSSFSSHYKEGDLSFSLLHKNFPTLYKPSTLVMSSQVTLCLFNTQVSVYCLVAIQSSCYLSWLFVYTSIFTILSYTPLNSYRSMLLLISIFGLKISLSLLTLLLITRESLLLDNNRTTPTSIVYSRQVRIINN